MKVFIINRSGHDFEKAEKFGELVYLSEGTMNKLATNQMFREFWDPIHNSEPDDLILPTGLSIMTGLACAMFGEKHGRLNLLIYVNGNYVERRLVLRHKGGENGEDDSGTGVEG